VRVGSEGEGLMRVRVVGCVLLLSTYNIYGQSLLVLLSFPPEGLQFKM
jgi:hypothetical protein